MQNMKRMEIRSYRNARLEIMDDGGDGWAVAIYFADEPSRRMLRNRVPHGLAVLLSEAEAYVDRRMNDGPLLDYP